MLDINNLYTDYENLPRLNLKEIPDFLLYWYNYYSIQIIDSLIKGKKWSDPELTKKFNILMNGSDPESISYKYKFIDFLKNNGYEKQTPKQILIKKGEKNIINTIINKFGNNKKNLICKPYNGARNYGIKIFDDIIEIENFIKSQNIDYIVQEYRAPKRDLRYIFHRDVNGNKWVMCYEKRETSGYTKELTGEDFEKVNNYMQNFIENLESENMLGVKLDTHCYDIGIETKSIGENINENIVFYEFQVPFAWAMDNIKGLKNKIKLTTRLIISLAKSGIKNKNK